MMKQISTEEVRRLLYSDMEMTGVTIMENGQMITPLSPKTVTFAAVVGMAEAMQKDINRRTNALKELIARVQSHIDENTPWMERGEGPGLSLDPENTLGEVSLQHVKEDMAEVTMTCGWEVVIMRQGMDLCVQVYRGGCGDSKPTGETNVSFHELPD